MKRCDTCEHYDNGKCRIDPPTPIMDSQDNLKTVWPKVYPDSWCGQWEPVPVASNTARQDQEFPEYHPFNGRG